jgi:glycine/D-amino acid oxidase-like deaminating enzyme
MLAPRKLDPVPTYYALVSPPGPVTEPFENATRADVAIIGAGFTGLSAALHLAEAGARVTVLEAETVGAGGSGRAFGQIAPAPRRTRGALASIFGTDVAAKIVDAVAAAPDLVLDLVKRHAISCSASKTGMIVGTYSSAGMRKLEANARYWQGRNHPVEVHDAQEAQRLIGSNLYTGCLLDRRAVTINPLAYVRGLAHAALRAGVSLHERSAATALHKDGALWQITTGAGSISAEQVILATGAYTGELWPRLSRSIIGLRGVQLVSKPLAREALASILPGRQTLSDTNRLSTAVRITEDGRLQTSAGGPFFDDGSPPDTDKAQARVSTLFPGLGRVEWEHGWSGWMDMSDDQLPHIHELAPGLFAAIGFSGRGIGIATLVGRDLAFRLNDPSDDRLSFPLTPLRSLRYGPLSAVLARALLSFYTLADKLHSSSWPSWSRVRRRSHQRGK